MNKQFEIQPKTKMNKQFEIQPETKMNKQFEIKLAKRKLFTALK